MGMTIEQFEQAREAGEVPAVTLTCYEGVHGSCRGRIIDANWQAKPCGCACHHDRVGGQGN